ncbi:hypothetical protein [Prolixibacter sp. NT017]|uniref:hypothetical protein n=1 Tax=Prolixibacter sp. NT017 TaxID=2652390 RepID=UPI0012854F06|nr:hypothetical protein [Prolixibacter sp. NT017]GET25259.1 hypothetical protein NT017_15880 [Prolixibacter sp. NT017]
MKQLATIFAVFTLLLSNAFAETPSGDDIQFLKDGVSFSLPADWKIISDEPVGKDGHYFSAEHNTEEATGVITVTWLNARIEPDVVIDSHKKNMRAADIYRQPGIEFTAIEPVTFAGRKAYRSKYATLVNGDKMEGEIICLNCEGKTISLFMQSGLDDKKATEAAFLQLEQTFGCREE